MSGQYQGWQGPSMSSTPMNESPRGGSVGDRVAVTIIRPVLMLGVAIAMTVVLPRMLGDRQAFVDGISKGGRTDVGYVTEATRKPQRGGIDSYLIHYEYRVGGATHRGVVKATEQQARAARVGQTLAVTYNPADPGRSIGTSLAEAKRDVKMARPVIYVVIAFFWGAAVWSIVAARNA